MSLLLLTLDQEQLSTGQIAAVKRNVPDGMSYVQSQDVDAIKQFANEVEILAGWFDPAWLFEMPRLRWVQQWGAGANWLMRYPEFRKAPFTLTNAVGIHAVPISEHVFALILAFGRNLPNAIAAQDKRVWARVKHPTESLDTPFAFSSGHLFELADKTLLILGVGAIGERVARLAQAFGMYVIGMRNNPGKMSPYVDDMIGADHLQEILSSVDFVVNTLPLTDATKHLFGVDELAAMKSSAFLINIGRGETIDESALIKALQIGTIAGAGLDVFEQEPPPDSSPLWGMPNVLITSHYAGATPRYHERALEIFQDNLQRYQNGQPLRNVVDKQRGY
jgi:phosphoglycerate dehydrogenase-like enzyme